MQIQNHRAGMILCLTTALAIFAGCGKPQGAQTASQPSANPPVAAALAPAEMPQPAAEAGGLVEVPGGKLYYEVSGSGPALVLIHDELLHGAIWDAQFADFSSDYRVIRYDRRGYGRSPASTTSYADTDDLSAVLTATNTKHAALIASGDGAALAVDFTSNHPDMVDVLVLVGPTIDGLGYSAPFVERFYANLGSDGQASAGKWADDRYLIAPANPTAREHVRAMLAANPQNLSREKHQYARPYQFDVPAVLSYLRVPTLILAGAEDIADVHAHAGAIESRVLGSRRFVLPDAGHLPHLEQPAAFNTTVRQFLSLVARRLNHVGLRRYRSGYAPVDGGALYYEIMGRGEPLVLIHGGVVDRRMWEGQVEAFAEKHRIVLYDVRGHGLSTGTLLPYSDCEDLRQLLKHLHIKSAHVMGLSLGGRIAIDFAITHADMVRCLIPVAPGLSGYNFVAPDLEENIRQLTEALQSGDHERARELMQRAWTDGPRRTPDKVDPDVREAVRNMLRFNMTPGRGMGRPILPSPPAMGRLGEIQASTLIVVGDVDMSDILKIVDKLCEEVPEARRVTIPGAAHMVNMEQPEAFNRAVLEFLEKH